MEKSEQNNNNAPGQNKEQSIIVNGRKKTFTGREISSHEVVGLSGLTSTNPNMVYTITYKRGDGSKPEGSMDTGDVVKVKSGMIFNVTATDKS